MKLRITVEGKTYDVDVEVLEGQGVYAPVVAASPLSPAPGSNPATLPSVPQAVPVAPVARPSAGSGDQVVSAPIAGTVIEIKVSPGDTVQVNQVLVVMEAMKMETNIASPVAGKVAAIRVTTREAVKAGQVLVEFE